LSMKPFTPRRMALYVLLQILILVFCWGWFAALWSIAFFNYDYDQIEWWLLFGSGLAGLYGLRPNLERAVDAYWLGKSTQKDLLKERAAQLTPVKKRIDLVFSVLLIAMLAVLLIVVSASWLSTGSSS